MSDGFASIIPLIILGVLAYFLFIRPARNRAKNVQKLQNSLSAGDRVMLTSGIFGDVEGIVDEHVRVEISPGVTVEVHRGAIGKIVRDEPTDDPGFDDPDAEPGDGPGQSAPDGTAIDEDPNSRGAS